MSDIIIEGKNLSDINQSNFQTVGVRSALYFDTNYTANESLSVDEDVFKHDTIDVHLARLSPDPIKDLLPSKLIEVATIEPWQGRLHFDRDFSYDSAAPTEGPYLGLFEGVNNFIPNWQPFNSGRPSGNPANPTSKFYYPYFYTGNLYEVDFQNEKLTRLVVNNLYARIPNNIGFGVEERESTSTYVVKDDRFPLGTYTEENKQYWEIQTSDPVSRNSQFSSTRMQIALSTKMSDGIIRSEEEQFSVDAFTFTERDGVITPLFFYYDKNLHPIEYNNATTGKVSMKIELRESGRNGDNELDLYQERNPVRPFLMGFEKDELRNGGFTIDDPPEELIGTGEIYGEGLYFADYSITLQAIANPDSYLLGIFDIPDDNLKSTGGANGSYTFQMPNEDVQYLAKFRPNPYIVLGQKFLNPETGNEQSGGSESKGQVRLWLSKLQLNINSSNYETVPLEGGFDLPLFQDPGGRVISRNFRPTDFGGDFLTLEQKEATTNFKFRGWTYESGSESIIASFEDIEVPTNTPGGVFPLPADQHYNGSLYGNLGGNAGNIKTIKLNEDFRYPNGRLFIYANYSLIMFTLNNLNNQVDFENNFADALKYGPFKFVTAKGNSPSIDDYKSTDLSQFEAFAAGDEKVRLLIAGPGMGYANAEYLPSGDNAHLTPIEETGYEFGDFFWHKTDDEEIPLRIDVPQPIPNTMENAIELNGGSEPTPTVVEGDAPFNQNGITLEDTQPSGYSVGTVDITGLFKVTNVQFSHYGGTEEGSEGTIAQYSIDWGPNITNQTRNVNKFRLDENERDDYKGVLLGDTVYLGSFEDAVAHNGGPLDDEVALPAGAPIPAGTLQSGLEYDYSIGSTHGLDDVFIVEDYDVSAVSSDVNVIYITWGVNPNADVAGGLSSNEINQIITTETTSSISYQPLQNGIYIKSRDLGANTSLTTAIVESDTSISGRVRSKEDSGAIDADMYGFGQTYRVTMTPSQASLPPEIDVFLAQENGDLTLSTNIFPGLTKEALGVEWNPDDWSPNGGGSFSYTLPESRDATLGELNLPLFYKYIEFRIQTLQTAEGEQSENNELVDPNFYVGLNVFGMPGAGGQIFNDFQQDQDPVLVSTGGLVNLFNIEEMVDENGIPYQEFSQIPDGLRTVVLRAVPTSGGFSDENSVGTWSFVADPGVDVDTVGSITQFWVGDPENDNFGHHLGIITFNQEGPVTVKYQWFGDGSGGGP